MAHTEGEFIRKRRRAAADAAASTSSQGYETLLEIGADPVGQSGWSDQHTKELDFQRQKLKARTLQAVAEGVMDGGDALKTEVKQLRGKRIKEQRARERKTERDNMKLKGITAAETLARIAGKNTYLEDDIASQDVLDAMNRFRMKRVASACNADVFVVGVPGDTGQRLALVTAIRGVTHVSPEILVSKGLRGVALKWKRLASIPRIVFVSTACHDRHRNTFNLFQEILRSCEAEGHQMQLQLGNWDTLTALKARYKSQKSRLIAITRSDELKLPVALFGGSRTCSEFNFPWDLPWELQFAKITFRDPLGPPGYALGYTLGIP
jgi:hypothetical protein